VLFLSSRYMVAPRFEDLPGFDGVACRTPFLPGARSSETGFVLLSMTVAIGRPQSRSHGSRGYPDLPHGIFYKNSGAVRAEVAASGAAERVRGALALPNSRVDGRAQRDEIQSLGLATALSTSLRMQ
jgi:hypothetical protein